MINDHDQPMHAKHSEVNDNIFTTHWLFYSMEDVVFDPKYKVLSSFDKRALSNKGKVSWLTEYP